MRKRVKRTRRAPEFAWLGFPPFSPEVRRDFRIPGSKRGTYEETTTKLLAMLPPYYYRVAVELCVKEHWDLRDRRMVARVFKLVELLAGGKLR
jgi:hypothetical protein